MIDQVTDHIVERFGHIRIGTGLNEVTIYPPDANREKGLTEYPHIAVNEPTWVIDRSRARPGHELFVPSADQSTTEVDGEIGDLFRAVVTASEVGPHTIVEGVNDRLRWRIGRNGEWSEEQSITFAASEWRTFELAWRILSIVPWRRQIVGSGVDGRLQLEAVKPGYDLELLEDPRGVYETVGLEPGIYSRLTRTGPVSYTVMPYPIPVRVLYQWDLRAAKKSHRDKLEPLITAAFGVNYCIRINDYPVVFGTPEVKRQDESSKPKYWTWWRYWVRNVWIDGLTKYEVGAITDINLSVNTG